MSSEKDTSCGLHCLERTRITIGLDVMELKLDSLVESSKERTRSCQLHITISLVGVKFSSYLGDF